MKIINIIDYKLIVRLDNVLFDTFSFQTHTSVTLDSTKFHCEIQERSDSEELNLSFKSHYWPSNPEKIVQETDAKGFPILKNYPELENYFLEYLHYVVEKQDEPGSFDEDFCCYKKQARQLLSFYRGGDLV